MDSYVRGICVSTQSKIWKPQKLVPNEYMWFHSIHWLGWSLRNICDFTIYIDLDDRYGIYVMSQYTLTWMIVTEYMWFHNIHWLGWSLRNICDFTVYIDLDDRYGIYVISQFTLTWTIVTEYMWFHSLHWLGRSLRNICDFTVYIDLDDRYGIYVISQFTLTWTIATEYMWFHSIHWLGRSLRNICVTNDNGYLPFVVITISSFPRLVHGDSFNWKQTTLATINMNTCCKHTCMLYVSWNTNQKRSTRS